jgi:hypothetical protein
VSSTPFTELSNSVVVDVPSFPLNRRIRLGGAAVSPCLKSRMDNLTSASLCLNCASAVSLPVHGSLEAFGMETLTDRSYATSHR